MEPVAVYLDYWIWAGPGIPVQNYLAWFFIALVVSAVAQLTSIRLNSHLLRYYLIIQFIFFLILNLSWKIF